MNQSNSVLGIPTHDQLYSSLQVEREEATNEENDDFRMDAVSPSLHQAGPEIDIGAPPLCQAENSFDEDLYGGVELPLSDAEITEGSVSDRVGQMKRGFVNPLGSDGEELGSSINHTSDYESDQLTSDEASDLGSFDFENMRKGMSKQAIASVAIHDLKLTHKLSRAACRDITDLIETLTDDKCWDYRTTKKWIEKRTGVKAISYDCCKGSCMSYAMYPEKVKCDHCSSPRWKERTKTPNATHEYIPITHRLRLWYADPVRAATMITYRRQAESECKFSNFFC